MIWLTSFLDYGFGYFDKKELEDESHLSQAEAQKLIHGQCSTHQDPPPR